MSRPGSVCTLATALAFLAACAEAGPPPPPEGAIPAGTSIGSSSVSGRALYHGEIPEAEVISMGSDPVCASRGAGRTNESVVVGPGGALANVFVAVESGLGDRLFAPPAEPVVMDQNGCAYAPHVLGVQVNQPLEIVNSDPTMHNVHSVPARNRPFNVGMAVQGQRVRKHFAEPEIMVRLKCDLHNWMNAWIGVSAHPFFAVSGPDGSWSITGLPAGTYTLRAWHERFGERRVEVAIGDGEAAEVEFDFSP